MTQLLQDVDYALRLSRRTPGFTAVAVTTLALAIGASTAIFAVVNAVLLRPLSFSDPQRLAVIRPSSGSRLSPNALHDWRLASKSFADMAGWYDARANLTGRGEPLEVLVDRATPNFFAVVGTPAALGHAFTVRTSLSDAAPEVVLSHAFWQRRYGGDPQVIGRPIVLDGETSTIVGVMPAGFTIRTNELVETRAQLWMPFRLIPGDRAGMGGFLNVVGRLAPGVTVQQAQAELSLITQRIEHEHPSYSRDWSLNVIPLHEATVKDARLTLLVLFGAVGILLLIACANVANLMLSRAATRKTELAIRVSLGATTGRLVRQFLTEGLVLAAAGGAFGVLLAVLGTRTFALAVPAGLELPRGKEIDVDLRVLLFALLVTTLTAVLFGLVTSLRSARVAPRDALREGTRGSSSGRSWNRLGGALTVSEVALALVLLTGAGLLGRSYWKLSRVDPGFQAEHVLTLRTTLPAARYDTADRIRLFSSALLARIAGLPGVRAAGSVNYLPMSSFGEAALFDIEGRPEPRVGAQPSAWFSVVGGRYFEAMGVPLLRGRLPGDADTETTGRVFVIDEELSRRYWPGQDPIGTRVAWRSRDETLSGEIVGVVGSVRWIGMAADPPAAAYWWLPQAPRPDLTIVARTLEDPSASAAAIAAQVRELDPNQPVAEIRALRDFVSEDLARPRFTMLLFTFFAAAALLIAAIGVYGVIAFGVSQRTQEIGIRVALGAQRRDILRLVMRRGLLLTGTGLVLGIAAALALGRLVTAFLYGVTASDPPTLLAIAVLLAAVALLATYLPARRAMRVDPMIALKVE